MKKLFTSALLILAALAVSPAFAAVLRVNNTPGVNAPYTSFAAAQTAAVAGDIIQLEPSNTSYGALTVNKAVTIMGAGYLLGTGQNTGLQYTALEASTGAVTFSAGSAGARITGLRILGDVNINVSSVTVERNILWTVGYGANYSIIINGGTAPGTSDVFVRGNWFGGMSGTGTSTNFNIANNIISAGMNMPATMSGMVTHNLFNYDAGYNSFGTNYFVYNSLVTNNIMFKPSGTSVTNNSNYYNRFATALSYNNTYTNNIGDWSAAFPNDGVANINNLNSVGYASIFTYTGSDDARYTLRPAPSPARGAGTSGVDCGIFGGVQPYVLGGIPNSPTIYQLNSNVSGTNLNVTVGTKSNN
ncbi:hypothetical protein GCM10023185_02640 [Hymenobacter saemangeumensis]|uniref:Right-handed parallel beta-helix repeat-containing protein n=1 Tax=Hymenobacter saemangeumensis TaxID=1084522 RepID=A0ABP8HYE2_9BACT